MLLKEELVFEFSNSKLLKSNGGVKRDRTADLLRARQALSQLSYNPILASVLSYEWLVFNLTLSTYHLTLIIGWSE